MGRTVKIFDTTLRDGEQTPGINLNSSDKLRIAHVLAKLGADVTRGGLSRGIARRFQRCFKDLRTGHRAGHMCACEG